MDALEDDDRSSLDLLFDLRSQVQREVVGRDLAVLARHKLLDLLKSQVEVKGFRMVEVVVLSVVVVLGPSMCQSSGSLTRGRGRSCPAR